jgi:Cu+-exporting ATPase
VVFYESKEEGITMKDPVCGMEINENHDSLEHKGKKYYFCCASCKWAFENNPSQFEES